MRRIRVDVEDDEERILSQRFSVGLHYAPVLGGGEYRNGSLILHFKSGERHARTLFEEADMGTLEIDGYRETIPNS